MGSSASFPSRSMPPPGSSTRLAVLGWCLWLLAGWLITLSTTSAVPAVRWMVYMALVGLMLIWPTVRLSQATPLWMNARAVFSETLLEWLCLILVFQAVIWPLRLTGQWPIAQTWWLDAAVAGWSMVTALAVAWGRSGNTWLRRMVALGLCIALLLGEPVLQVMLPEWDWHMRTTPIPTVWALSAPPAQWNDGPWAVQAGSALATGILGWLAAGTWLQLTSRASP